MDLKELTLGLIADGKKERERAKQARTRKGQRKARKFDITDTLVKPDQPIIDPWTKHSVVLLTTHTSCKCCGEVMISCEPGLYVEMSTGSRAKGTLCRKLERITNYGGMWHQLYASLPKRVEPRLVEVEACPFCFGFEADNNGLHYSRPDQPTQLELDYESVHSAQEPSDRSHDAH